MPESRKNHAGKVFTAFGELQKCVMKSCAVEYADFKGAVEKRQAPVLAKLEKLKMMVANGLSREKFMEHAAKLIKELEKISVAEMKTEIGRSFTKCKISECGLKVAEYVSSVTKFLDSTCKEFEKAKNHKKCTPELGADIEKFRNLNLANESNSREHDVMNIQIWMAFMNLVIDMDKK